MADNSQNLSVRIIRSAMWQSGQQWGLRALGLFNIAILARLLIADDFGLMAIIASVSEFGLLVLTTVAGTALVRLKDCTAAHAATAWWIRLVLGVVIGALLFAVAPMFADLFSKPDLAAPMAAMALVVLVDCTASTQIFVEQRHLSMRSSVYTVLWREVTRMGTGIGLALTIADVWGGVWALVLAQLAGALVSTVQSHRLAPMQWQRPARVEARALLHVFGWGTLEGLGGVFYQRIDRLLLAPHMASFTLGLYSVAVELALLPIRLIVSPLVTALLPGLMEARGENPVHDPARVTLALTSSFAFILPASVGMAVVAEPFIVFYLGDAWAEAGPILASGAVLCFSASYFTILRTVLVAAGALSMATWLSWAQGAAFALLIWGAPSGTTASEFALIKGLSGLAVTIAAFYLVVTRLQANFSQLLADGGRSVLASAVMVAVLSGLETATAAWGIAGHTIAMIFGGAGVYLLCRLLLWNLSGRPDSLEARLLAAARSATL